MREPRRVPAPAIVTSILVVLSALPVASDSFPEEIPTPAEAAAHESKGTIVTVELPVKFSHRLVPDGKHVRLFSEPSFRDEKAFAVNLTPKVVEGYETKDLSEELRGRTVSATGKVTRKLFSSVGFTRPGINVDDPANFRVLPQPVTP